MAACHGRALLGGGSPPLFHPPCRLHALSVCNRLGVSVPRRFLLACRTLGACAAGFRPPPPSPSWPGWPPLLWPHGHPPLPGPPRRLDRPPSPAAPVSCTRDALVHRARTGAVGDGGMPRQGTLAAGVRRRPRLAHPLAVATSGSSCLSCSGGGGGFVPAPPPVSPPLSLYRPRWSLRGFCPPRAIRSLRGC